jgi:hypothetical protein
MSGARPYIEVMAKHLPPSAATLQLLDVGGTAGATLAEIRADLNIASVCDSPTHWQLSNDSLDAIIAYDYILSREFLSVAMAALRPGGRLIVANPHDRISEAWVKTFENAGYTRILVELALDGILLRGEKPHIEQSTHDRIQQVATYDANLLDLAAYNGRYVHLLIRQTPNKPSWKLTSDKDIEWQAVAVHNDGIPTLLAFSSLPKAVAFMQPAVLAGHIRDVNKVAKFSRETVREWAVPVLLNPTIETIESRTVLLLSVDPQTAETPDE